MVVFDVSAPPATLLKAVIKHIINLPPPKAPPSRKDSPLKPLYQTETKKVISFFQPKLHFCAFSLADWLEIDQPRWHLSCGLGMFTLHFER